LTEDDFRRLALALPEATESAHMDHPDFRVGGKIFATLRYPSKGWAMVKLPSNEQEAFMKVAPEVFAPIKGAWGRRGATNLNLKTSTIKIARDALAAAWRNCAPKRLLRT
jgi:hypothetical protein